MKLSIFDTHCDTALELYQRNEDLDKNTCHISLENMACFDKFAQLFAIWSERRLDDEACYTQFLKTADYFDAQVKKFGDKVAKVEYSEQLDAAFAEGKRVGILAVEDARLLAGNIDRLDTLYDRGVRYLTLMWAGNTCIGGSHDTENGLTDFGKQVAAKCFEKGIIPDVSHSSAQTVDDLAEIAYKYNKPFIASHSDSYSQHQHTRNIRDRHFEIIKDLGGIVGINLCNCFLMDATKRNANIEDIVRHVDRFMELGGQDIVGLGCDLDGIDTLPDGMKHGGDLTLIAEALSKHGYSDELINKIFFENFYNFFKKNLPGKANK